METSLKPSRETRSSRRSLRSSHGSSIDANTIGDATAVINEKRLQKLLEEEEHELVVYAIREELMKKVMEECEKIYLEKQCVKFTAHCAYRALVQIINLGLFHHDPGKPYYQRHPSWMPDSPPLPSPPDTWAAGKVTIKPKPVPVSPEAVPPTRSDTATAISVEENVFTGIKSDMRKSVIPTDVDDIEVLYQDKHVMPEGFESEFQLFAPHATEVSLIEEEEHTSKPKRIVQALSIFTQTTRMPPEQLPRLKKFGSSKIKGLVPKVPEESTHFEMDQKCVKSKMSVGVLPALRTNTKYAMPTPSSDLEKEDVKMPPITKK